MQKPEINLLHYATVNYGELEKRQHGFLLEVRILNEIKAIAEKENRSMNEVANRLLDQAIRTYNGESVSLDAVWGAIRGLTDRISSLESAGPPKKRPSKT